MDGVKREGDRLIVSTKVLCDLLDVSDRTLTDWKRKGLIQHSRGWWDLKHVLKWRGDIYSDDTEDRRSINLQQKKLEVEIALKEAQSELTRLKADITNGKYIDKELVEAELSRFFVVFKKSAMALSKKLAAAVNSYVDPVEARRIEKNLDEIICDALEQMSVDGVYHVKKKAK